ncbi:hypothetical protein BKA65DRAFT_456587 [Rhexocercosporidium sp. MPI-PUGE-AT-0058]|nr:hypothetical protein BKA65DRAFT_456587 [Rhexocercosporidium sp. MPI-PUGE-AT-0058]
MATNSDSDSESAAMAAAMGFSSFGHKPAAKKRKFNPTTDAFVEGQALEKLDRGGKKGTGSGGNMIPLGKTRVIGSGSGGKKEKEERRVENGDEIALDKEDGDTDDGPQYIDTSAPAPIQDNRKQAYVKSGTSEPAPAVSDAEALEMQRRIDAILQSIGSAPPPPSNDMNTAPPGKTSYTSARSSRGARSEARSEWGGSSWGGSSRGGNRGRGERNDKWYVGYYDPGFNINPWEALEKERGLEPVGKWLEYPKGQGRGGQRT